MQKERDLAGKIPVRLAAGSGPTFGVDDLACAAATHLGFWSDEGLDVSWTPVFGGVAAVKAVLDGVVDAGYGGLGPVLKHRCEGHPVTIFVSMARGLAQNLVVQKHITSVEQLKGASWALDGFGALSHHMARLIVAASDIDESGINWEAVGPPPQRIARLLAGTIDASLIRVEEAIALSHDSGNSLHTLLGFGELKTLVPVQPHGVLSTVESFARRRPDVLDKLTRGMILASRALHSDYDAFRKTCAHYVSVNVAESQFETIWRQERESGGFAINGELSQAHWQAQLESYFVLNPGLPRIGRDGLIIDRHVKTALAGIGVMEGADKTM